MNERIRAALREVERQFEVRILLAVESGSRAWGFASPDSDYDVRFVYAHPRDWYLSVGDARDVIEQMLPGDLDFSGWELRKALRLFAKCNFALNEWLGSPVTYQEIAEFRRELLELVPGYFNPIAGVYHYRKMAQTALENVDGNGQIGIKKIFYVMRPLLACRWIENAHSQPPTEFSRLVDAAWVADDERRWITQVLETKARAAEAYKIQLEASRASAWRDELAHYEAVASTLPAPGKAGLGELDALLRRWTPF